jgi:hypothetical protein
MSVAGHDLNLTLRLDASEPAEPSPGVLLPGTHWQSANLELIDSTVLARALLCLARGQLGAATKA